MYITKAILVHDNKYDYSETVFVNQKTKVKILCKEHGYFEQLPQNHIKGDKCYRCTGIVKNTKDFIDESTKVHNNLYDYSKTIYTITRKDVIIICKSHGEFKQKPNDHLSGCGCQKCGMGCFSKVCIEWLNSTMTKDGIFIQHAGNLGEKSIIVNNKTIKFDGFCKETNTVYEFHGDFFHGNPIIYSSEKINPLIKKTFGDLYIETLKRENIIKELGYNLITIWESDYRTKE